MQIQEGMQRLQSAAPDLYGTMGFPGIGAGMNLSPGTAAATSTTTTTTSSSNPTSPTTTTAQSPSPNTTSAPSSGKYLYYSVLEAKHS